MNSQRRLDTLGAAPVTTARPCDARGDRIIDSRRLELSHHFNAAIVTALGTLGVVFAAVLTWVLNLIALSDVMIFFAFFIPIQLGVTMGFHRHFTHRSFEASPSVRTVLAILGCMAGQGPPVFWAALHRHHHEFSDREGDPHSPNLRGPSLRERSAGLFHSYIGWTVRHRVPNAMFYARDLLRDEVVMRVNRRYAIWFALGLALPTLVGLLTHGGSMGASRGFVWGGLVRMFVGHHMIWWITSFAHVFGRREYASGDRSTNNFWIAIPTLGEGWHNNHHAVPTAARLNFKWWQIDITGWVITALQRLGLVRNVRIASPEMLAARRVKPQQ